ncbi:MAG: hypothetical protein MK084_08120 [Prochlorococcus sp. ALOHA_A2.0_50]|nr:hypothetical protein [Prochlorococcus sp. ALOHA_A2.0_50]
MNFNKKLTSPEKAKQFIFDLKKNSLDFHFDDDIEDIFKGRFSELEINQLKKRIEELFILLDDPFKYLV